MITCTRVIEWDMGHRVYGHEGKCRQIHGHRYKAEITCQAAQLDELERVVDFGSIKSVVGKWIDETWDHRTMLMDGDPLVVSLRGSGVVVVPRNPTAETIAQMLLAKTNQMLSAGGLSCVRVRVWETPNCYAEAT